MRLYEEGAGFMRPVRPRATRPVSALESIQIEVDMNLGAMAGGERDHEHPGCAGAIYFQPSTCHGWLGLLNIICWTSEHSEESGKTSTQTGQTWSNCSLLRSSFQPQTHGSVVPALDMSHCRNLSIIDVFSCHPWSLDVRLQEKGADLSLRPTKRSWQPSIPVCRVVCPGNQGTWSWFWEILRNQELGEIMWKL